MSSETSNTLKIQNLHATINDIPLLNGVNLTLNAGEIHTIMGPNGSGKSTLSKVISGHPSYSVTQGNILWNDKSILDLSPEQRAQMGIFLAFQYPVEIPGVSNIDFLRLAYNTRQKNKNLPELDPLSFLELASEKLKLIDMDPSFLNRSVNEGFSGGEKKRNEILQMALLDTYIAILDETDSGLDIDALKSVAQGILKIKKNNTILLVITHYQRLLNYIHPDFVHVMEKGQIIKTGNISLAQELEQKGYNYIKL
uniref:Iron-sulfur cluster formation ABC transporter ATP-binding subunit n=1 Tax=Bangiopsis subsimplex TaxID=139980 RepID=A0A1C9CCV0_9RHOD|nr:iron-sulfur cluster formation ABC transporter ATP-binding subunit [Bangiopsis subsimplex]AOM66205.1 iron-sulfur cluster formation ABC transporter ATP-binding subunit [Bangiopsis subsimplex]ARO90434.1 iron-sulfur cluster formation ABC transporter ATP-binding subunit [Bangiopsis subsimplex]